ncbi:hypothetical protein ACH4L5_22035 [Streptomyces sp. NPDC017405]|uniref:hypothetical protein n=1 Tax=unclassified Streptomyces TaxID=2593676 RepID=UPI0037B72D57
MTSDVSKVSNEEAALSVEETILAQTAWFLHERGDVQAAALLLDVEGIEWSPGNRFGDWMDARLLVPGWLMDRFSEDLLARIRDALLPIAERNGVEGHYVYVGPALPDVAADWRSALQGRLTADTTTNHAARHRSETGTATRRIRF